MEIAPVVQTPLIPCRIPSPSSTIEEDEGARSRPRRSRRRRASPLAEDGLGLEFAFEVEHFAEVWPGRRRRASWTDLDFTVASLGKNGAVFGTEGQEDNENAPSILHFTTLIDGERRDAGLVRPRAARRLCDLVQVVCAGDDFVAACTSRDLIRIYSTGGVELRGDGFFRTRGRLRGPRQVHCAIAYHGPHSRGRGRQHCKFRS